MSRKKSDWREEEAPWFVVTLIRLKGKQSPQAKQCIKDNCSHITKNFYVFEGDIGCLDDEGVKYITIGEGIIPAIGDKTEKQRIEIVDDCIGVDVLSNIKFN